MYKATLVSYNLVLMSYLSGICLESWFSWLGGGVQKTLKKKRETDGKRNIEKWNKNKNEEFKESQTTINTFGLIFYIKKVYFARKHSLKNVVYTIAFYLQS